MNENTATDSRRLASKVALITGASRGIGLAMTRALAAQSCALIITGRDQTALETTSREVGAQTRIRAKTCDITKPEDVSSLLQFVREEFGHVDILINNAGISHSMAPVDKLDPQVWDRVIATNLTGMFLVTRAALPLMQAGAAIVNNLSGAAKIAFAGEAAYIASKHGALGLTRTLREELRAIGIRVIALLPGPTDTEIWNQFWPEAPRAKMLSPETIADAVIGALLLPQNASVDELVINPVTGTL
jgi:NAD(P)-dependent dehydrogenase (short-subunit alcohol dehydrogenase family)